MTLSSNRHLLRSLVFRTFKVLLQADSNNNMLFFRELSELRYVVSQFLNRGGMGLRPQSEVQRLQNEINQLQLNQLSNVPSFLLQQMLNQINGVNSQSHEQKLLDSFDPNRNSNNALWLNSHSLLQSNSAAVEISQNNVVGLAPTPAIKNEPSFVDQVSNLR